ncbi:hypothetical protein ACT7DN_30350 [Bacillus paranthracis]
MDPFADAVFNRLAERMASLAPNTSGNGSGDINQYITIHSPTPLSESEIARKTKQASRDLAMEWRR